VQAAGRLAYRETRSNDAAGGAGGSGLLLQYMLGDAFLTCAFTDTIVLPERQWIDYWTGKAHDGPMKMKCTFPEDRGGPLFVRAGAIIPTDREGALHRLVSF